MLRTFPLLLWVTHSGNGTDYRIGNGNPEPVIWPNIRGADIRPVIGLAI